MSLAAHRKVVMEYVSASQVEAFLACNRKWYNKSVLKIPEAFSPAAARGSRVHKAGEIYLTTGKPGPVPAEDQGILDALLAALPQPSSNLLVEHKFTIPTYDAPQAPQWTGYIDLLDPDFADGIVLVQDQKSRSDFRYCKKPQDLVTDVQMISYAWFAMNEYDVDQVMLRHLYVCTQPSGRKPNKYFKTMNVDVLVTRNHVSDEWQRILKIVGQMADWYAKSPDLATALPPNVLSCEMYGGCTYKKLCGLAGHSPGKLTELSFISKKPALTASTTTEVNMGMTLEEKLAAKKAAREAAAGGAPAAPAQAAKPPAAPAVSKPNGVAKGPALNPPDAAPETKNTAVQPTKTPAAPAAETKTKAKKPSAARNEILAAAADDDSDDTIASTDGAGSDIPADPEPLPPAAKTKPIAKAPVDRSSEIEGGGFVIYIDCIPVKGVGDPQYVMFEDWFCEVGARLAESFGVADYRVVEFGKWKGPLANLVRMSVNDGNVPPVLIVSSYAPGVNETLDVLIPFAKRVVRALKG